jgi:hypothetical protein
MPVKTYKGIKIHKVGSKWFILTKEKGLPYKSGATLSEIKKRVDRWEHKELSRDIKRSVKKTGKDIWGFRVIRK